MQLCRDTEVVFEAPVNKEIMDNVFITNPFVDKSMACDFHHKGNKGDCIMYSLQKYYLVQNWSRQSNV